MCRESGKPEVSATAAQVIADSERCCGWTDLTARFTEAPSSPVATALESALTITADGATTQLTMKGSLSYEGQVDGSCDWDLTMKVATTGAAGGTPGVNAEYSGTMCGHKASATLNVQG